MKSLSLAKRSWYRSCLWAVKQHSLHSRLYSLNSIIQLSQELNDDVRFDVRQAFQADDEEVFHLCPEFCPGKLPYMFVRKYRILDLENGHFPIF